MVMRRNGPEFERYYWAYRKSYDETVAFMRSRFPQLGAFFEGLPSAYKPAEVVPANTMNYSNAAEALTWNGRNLVHVVLRDKTVPRDKIKAFESAFRAFNWKRRPKNSVPWFARNLKAAQLLLETHDWPDKGAASEEEDARVFKVGSFTVHDQTGSDIKATTQILVRAEQLVRASDVPNVDKALYGDVYFVGQIERKKRIHALYYSKRDEIALLVVKRFVVHELGSLIHEIGHRYYQRIWTDAQRKAWRTYDHALHQAPHVPLPEIGTVFQGRTVTGYKQLGPAMFIMFDNSEARVNVDAYVRHMQGLIVAKNFPTPYAQTDPEEHFCEAFSLYCRGELKEPNLSAFREIVVGRRAANPRLDKLHDTVVRLQRAKGWKPKLPGGPRKHPRNFPTAALVRGAKVEFEHTNDPRIAVEIAISHLVEDSRYYEKLAVMERRRNARCARVCRVPFPTAPHPAAGSKSDEGAVVRSVRLADLTATQQNVSRHGLEKHKKPLSPRAPAKDLPLVYRRAGKLYIIDGHHRLSAAALRGVQSHRVRLVDLKLCANPRKNANSEYVLAQQWRLSPASMHTLRSTASVARQFPKKSWTIGPTAHELLREGYVEQAPGRGGRVTRYRVTARGFEVAQEIDRALAKTGYSKMLNRSGGARRLMR